MNLPAKLEALLFYRGEPEKPAHLAKLLAVSVDEIDSALKELEHALIQQERGIRLLYANGTVELRTAPELADLIEKVRKDELKGDIGKAGAETLALICYRGPISRAEIDHIRGVSSTFILRNLQIRGLIERTLHPKDQRRYVYQPSADLLAHLGLTRLEDLPEYHVVSSTFDQFNQEVDARATGRDSDAADEAAA